MERELFFDPSPNRNNEELLDPSLSLEEIRLAQQRLLQSVARGEIPLEQALARSDKLTLLAAGRDQMIEGIGNRRWFDTRLLEEMTRALRDNQPLTVISLDLDKFKPVNDLLGHAVGDEVLKGVGSVLKRSVRKIDPVARLGGDEFGVILPQADSIHALVVAYRILRSIPGLTPSGYESSLSASIGVAEWDYLDDQRSLMRSADMGLYAIKGSTGSGIGLATARSSQITIDEVRERLFSIASKDKSDFPAIMDRTTLVHR